MADDRESGDRDLERQSMYKLFVMDVDGTLTDGKIYMSSTGEQFKAFDIKDGYGIKHILKYHNIKTAIITGRESGIVQRRAEELVVDYLCQGVVDKLVCLEQLVETVGCSFADVVYIGDDVNDLQCMEKAGLSCCPRDAHESVKKVVKYVAQRGGGQGAVREVVDRITEQGMENKDEAN